MASAAPPRNINRQHLQCPVCHKPMKDPKLLPCLHQCCMECLEKTVAKEDTKVECPTCHKQHDLPADRLEGLKTDLISKNATELFTLLDSVREESVRTCIHCSSKQQVDAFCFLCDDFLCQSCHEFHKTSKMMRRHLPRVLALGREVPDITSEEMSSVMRAPRCRSHPQLRAQLCCATCENVPICVKCCCGKHKGHDLQEAPLLAKTGKEKLTKGVSELTQYKETIQKVQESIEREIGKVTAVVVKKRKKLQEQLDVEAERVKAATSDADEKLKQSKRDIEKKLERKAAAREEELEQMIKGMRERNNQALEKERQEADAEIARQQKENEEEREKLGESLSAMNKEIKMQMTSLENLEDENVKKLKEMADHFQGLKKQVEHVTDIASGVLAAKHYWTDAHCSPVINEAIESLIEEVKGEEMEFPELELSSDEKDISLLPTVTEGRVNITETKEYEIDIQGLTPTGSVYVTGSREDSATVDTRRKFVTAAAMNGSTSVAGRRNESSTIGSVPAATGRQINITKTKESEIDINKTIGRQISDITGCKDGRIVVTGRESRLKTYFTVINMEGEQQRSQICRKLWPHSERYGCMLSQTQIASVCPPNGVSVYDIEQDKFQEIHIRNVIVRIAREDIWTKSVATDPENGFIFAGCERTGIVYVFSDQLEYVKLLQLPEKIKQVGALAFHQGNLLVCDHKRAYTVSTECTECEIVHEFARPSVHEADWFPQSVCTDRNEFVYILWGEKVDAGEQSRHVFVQYDRYDGRILTTRSLDADISATSISVVDTGQEEKILILSSRMKKILVYGVTEEE